MSRLLHVSGLSLALCWPAALVAQDSADAGPHFEVSTVRPAPKDARGEHWDLVDNMLVLHNVALSEIIRNACELKTRSQVQGGPDWMHSEHFDITAKTDEVEAKKLRNLGGIESDREYGALLLSLLRERFGLQIVFETRKAPVYALRAEERAGSGKGSLRASVSGSQRHMSLHGNRMTATAASMDDLADIFSGRPEVGQRVVLNRTGLSGGYDFELTYTPDHGQGVSPDATEPGLIDALHEQLGLRLVRDEGEIPVVVVQSVRKPDFD